MHIPVLIICQLIAVVKTQLRPLVETRNGFLYGAHLDNSYTAYRAIPYAEPPVGELRFEAPQALRANWSVTLNARWSKPTSCLQWETNADMCFLKGAEDCLYLNVFVPLAKQHSLLPVIFFIHGGGFMWGSADFYGERYIMQQQNSILVTINYRLGVFGFLSTEDEAILGNMGLKDQSLALRWVHENIQFFGGDAQQLLLAGWSAGGASVSLHMVSDMTPSSWFKSAVSFSGTALCACHTIYAGESAKLAKRLAQKVNCTQDIKKCLKSKSHLQIMQQVPTFYKFLAHPFVIFQPVFENTTSKEAFLTTSVEDLILQRRMKSKPYLLAQTAQDGAFGAAEFLTLDENGQPLIKLLNEQWQDLAPILLFFDVTKTVTEQRNLALNLRTKYFGTENIDLKNYKKLENLFNVELNVKHINRMAQLYANFTIGGAVYGYVYDNPPPVGFGHIFANNSSLHFGTVHGDDIFLIFDVDVRKAYPFRPDEAIISRNLIKMLVNMAKTGKPVYDGIEFAKLFAYNNFQFHTINKYGIKTDIVDQL